MTLQVEVRIDQLCAFHGWVRQRVVQQEQCCCKKVDRLVTGPMWVRGQRWCAPTIPAHGDQYTHCVRRTPDVWVGTQPRAPARAAPQLPAKSAPHPPSVLARGWGQGPPWSPQAVGGWPEVRGHSPPLLAVSRLVGGLVASMLYNKPPFHPYYYYYYYYGTDEDA